MPLAVYRSLMGAMISTGAKNLADGPSFADRFYARNGIVWPAPSPVCMLACRESTRLHVPFFFFQEGKRKSPGERVQSFPGLTGVKHLNPVNSRCGLHRPRS
jgi:hypothetical protein